ncbi:MAG: altronate dehydratase [Clostridia bacterium]|nr:altronate dehydratase [Clostridia bacterium]
MKAIKINPLDNVMVALQNLTSDMTIDIDDQCIELKEAIDKGHKFAIADIAEGEKVIKYGNPIGYASKNIVLGTLVHTHNVKTTLSGKIDYHYKPEVSRVAATRPKTFMGYKRVSGDVGIRNELWIVPTVGCVNGIGMAMLEELKRSVDLSHVDAVEIFKHNYGCSQLGKDHQDTQKILADMVKHPNAGGVLLLGLGCENNQIQDMLALLEGYPMDRVRTLVTQEVDDEVEIGVAMLKELSDAMEKDVREPLPVSLLKIGLKCGGSDGLSGITANPLVGAFSDELIGQGGSTILTEVPEMFGAEQLLMNRCVTEAIYDKTVKMIDDFKDYYTFYNQPIYENPSPGNKKGGITTLEDKSLGCTQKSGTAPVVDVLAYGQLLTTHGLNLLSAPGNDLVAATALGASGCHMVLFTTGRGTPFGSFVPTVKIASNSQLANKKKHWIDFNAGRLVEGASMEAVLEDFYHYVIEVASGRLVNNELHNYREIAIFKTGVTL